MAILAHGYPCTEPVEIRVWSTQCFAVFTGGTGGIIAINGELFVVLAIVDDTTMLIARPIGAVAHLN